LNEIFSRSFGVRRWAAWHAGIGKVGQTPILAFVLASRRGPARPWQDCLNAARCCRRSRTVLGRLVRKVGGAVGAGFLSIPRGLERRRGPGNRRRLAKGAANEGPTARDPRWWADAPVLEGPGCQAKSSPARGEKDLRGQGFACRCGRGGNAPVNRPAGPGTWKSGGAGRDRPLTACGRAWRWRRVRRPTTDGARDSAVTG